MLETYGFAEGGNSALAEYEIPRLKPEEVRGAQESIQKLASVEDFMVRWGMKGRKNSIKKEIQKRSALAEKGFETGRQFEEFQETLENFIRTDGYWNAEDGEWDGLFEDDIGDWYKAILDEIFIATERFSSETLLLITETQVDEFCTYINNIIATKARAMTRTLQIRSIPEIFPTTLWADVIEFTKLYIRLEKSDAVPSLDLAKEEFLDFGETRFSQSKWDPMKEFISRWDPEKNFYWDECSKNRTQEFAKRMRAVNEERIRKEEPNRIYYVTRITRKSLYRALRGDVEEFLQKNVGSFRSKRAKRETREYFTSEQLLLAVMNRVEKAFKNYHGPDRVEFVGGIQLTEDEKTVIRTIQSARGPVDGDMG